MDRLTCNEPVGYHLLSIKCKKDLATSFPSEMRAKYLVIDIDVDFP